MKKRRLRLASGAALLLIALVSLMLPAEADARRGSCFICSGGSKGQRCSSWNFGTDGCLVKCERDLPCVCWQIGGICDPFGL